MTKHFFTIVLLLATTFALGANRTFVRSYTYQASESDSKISARANALTEVKRLLLEELGVYMESYVNYTIEEENLQITKDFFTNEIKQLSVGITETKILEETWNGEQYYIKAEIVADPTDVVRKINQTLEKRQADAVIDSLHILLSTSQQNMTAKNTEIEKLNAQLATQNATTKAQEQKVATLNQQLSTMRVQLAQYQQEEQQIKSEIERIQQRLQSITTKAVTNARAGMTPEEVKQVCGEPRQVTFNFNESWYNYGYVWLGFSNGVLLVCVPIEVWHKTWDCHSYGDRYTLKH